MREITTHKGNELDDALRITVLDEASHGGAYHAYEITGPEQIPGMPIYSPHFVVVFQSGPVKEAGVNGISIESLLAICIDRLEGFQSGPFANDYNQDALDHLLAAQIALQARTKERMSRGVEGTSQS